MSKNLRITVFLFKSDSLGLTKQRIKKKIPEDTERIHKK